MAASSSKMLKIARKWAKKQIQKKCPKRPKKKQRNAGPHGTPWFDQTKKN